MAQAQTREDILDELASLGTSKGLMARFREHSTDDELRDTLAGAKEQLAFYEACGIKRVDPITGK